MDVKQQNWLNEVLKIDPDVLRKVPTENQLWRYFRLGKSPRQALREVKLDQRRCPPHFASSKGQIEWLHRKSPLTGMEISIEHMVYTCRKCGKKVALTRGETREFSAAEWNEFEHDWLVESQR
jgi:hypothetical protein